PALKYQLLPEMSEMNPGNPVQGYMLCFTNYNFFHLQEVFEQREKWLGMPLKDLPVGKVLSETRGGWVLEDADFAARLDTADWQALSRLKRDGAHTVLPDVQEMRSLAEVLKLRFRAQAASRRFDDAIGGAKTMFALSRHLGEHPAGVAAVVGFAIADMALDPLEEMIQQPGCPNMFWALSNLPSPLIDLRKGMQFERTMFTHEFALLDEAAPMTDAQLQTATKRLIALFGGNPNLEKERKDFQIRLKAFSEDRSRVDAARKRLIEAGIVSERVKQFEPTQVILLDEKRAYEICRDDLLKLTALPYWQIESVLEDGKQQTAKTNELLFARMLGNAGDIRPMLFVRAQVYRQQRIAMLCCVEGLRIFAVEHDGKLPDSLDAVALPLPVDPVTSKQFSYRLDGSTATLRGTPPQGKEKNAFYASYIRRYEITIQK
ncbi:MAG TPA: hypothetical protein VG056_12665, partial [Pirellulales bacterium]|nr:hypothetical protein [Pirellulales bacterium]